MAVLKFVFVLFLFCNVINILSACPSEICSCTSRGILNCSSRRLDRIPTFEKDTYAEVYDVIDLSHNQIYFLEPNAFKLTPARAIAANDNPLVGISPRALVGCEQYLTKLDLHQTGLRVIHWGLFAKLHKLKSLNLSNNELFALPVELFERLSALTELNLSHNKLTTLTNTCFYQLTVLKTLNLQGNDIRHIDDDIFDNLSQLLELDLSRNQLDNVDSVLGRGLSSLTFLDLSHNRLTDMPSVGALAMVSSLQKLHLDFNNISAIAQYACSKLSKLTSLSMANNRIASIALTAFNGLGRLGSLDLSNNQLKSLGDECHLAGTEYLISLKLDGNPLDCTCKLAWTRSLVVNGATVLGTCESPQSLQHTALSAVSFESCNDIDC